MIVDSDRKDLFVLVADRDMEQTFLGLLERPQSLEIAQVSYEVQIHPGRDGGCRSSAVEYLRHFPNKYRHALVVFDLDGSGSHLPREETQREVEEGLRQNGWNDRAKTIVIEPELEAWVWSASAHVPEILGWNNSYANLKHWLCELGQWPTTMRKPPQPKEAMDRTLRESHARRSSRKFFDLARKVSLADCRDQSFNELRTTLQDWFPR